MAYFYYTLTFFFMLTATVLYVTRDKWKPYAPPIPYLTAPGTIPEPLFRTSEYFNSFRYVRLPTSATFAEDAEAGLHSSTFNLAENIGDGDSRSGLDMHSKQQVYRIMKLRGVNFDEARRIFVEERFGREGIGADGRPLDRKAIMFS
ncbi:hypothetical protein K470DRAFT_221849 [Piedraia hortae CBS 480.64]|uniref:Uncharacterized protein n=1 Tax=Piedraia hortae CBS 480.64 TaxID=1314780 RepID=A0A6A7BSR4_9PEZI|nr:hypothetical protein K470DRAFT_221849 [Piedraia hortae CBS 480.64]